jgi:hypothetical protein
LFIDTSWFFGDYAWSAGAAPSACYSPGMSEIRESENLLVVESRVVPLAKIFFVAFLVLAVLACVQLLRSGSRILAAAAGAGLCLLGFLATFERTSFAFDRRERVVRWSRRRALRRREGAIPFDRIEAVAVQSPVGDDEIPTRRVTLMTRDGELPLTLAYAPDRGEHGALADRIRRFVFPAVPEGAEPGR